MKFQNRARLQAETEISRAACLTLVDADSRAEVRSLAAEALVVQAVLVEAAAALPAVEVCLHSVAAECHSKVCGG